MSGDVCMFDKFGFCKWGSNCNKIHLKETCLLEECENKSRCQKRHPRPCKYTERGFCKYGDSCRFDHRPPKYLRSLISRLDALEKENKRLLKVIEDQDKKIDKISENENGATTKNPEDEARLVSIQKQVNELEGRQKEAITEAIKKLAKGVDDKFKFFNTSLEIIKERVEHLESLEDQEDEEEEEVELEENFEKTNKERNEEAAEEKTKIFIKKSLQILDFMEKEVQKLRKNACQKDIKEKFMLYWNKIENELENLDPIAFVRHHDCEVEVNKMKLVLSEAEKSGTKFDKDDCLRSVNSTKANLTKLV